MNNDRRKRVSEIKEQLLILQDDIDNLFQEEQESFDNLPEQFKSTERGEKMQTSLDSLSNAYDNMDLVVMELDTAVEA